MYKFFLSCICSATFLTVANAQYRLSGTIRNEDRLTLVGAHIKFTGGICVTDQNGTYLISSVTIGKLNLMVSFIGYKPVDTIIQITGDKILDFTLSHTVSSLNEVTVMQKANSLNTSVYEQKLKSESIEKYSSKTLGDALREIAGVNTLKTGSTVVKPVINGLYGSRVPVISNNVRLEDQEWGTEHAPNFDINAAAKITVIKGASGLQFGGDAVGGLVIIEPVSVAKDSLFGKTIMTFSSNGRGGTLSSSLHKCSSTGWSWNALGTFKYMGDRESPNYVLSNSGNREANFSGDLKYSRKKNAFSVFYSFYGAKIGILSASHTGNATDLYNSINKQIPYVVRDFTYDLRNPKQDVHHNLIKLNYNRSFVHSGLLSIQYSFQCNRRLEYDVRRGNYNDKPALDFKLKTHAISIDCKEIFGNLNFKLGTNGSYQTNFPNPDTGIVPLIPQYRKREVGIYVIGDRALSNTTVLESGIRYDFSNVEATKFYKKSRWDERGYNPQFSTFITGENGNQWLTHPEFTFHNVSASLGTHSTFSGGIDLYANVSLASRNPNPSEFFSDGLHHSTGLIELGNLALDQEQSYKGTVTIQKRWPVFSLELNPYINYIRNYMFLSPSGIETTIRGAFPVWQYGKTNAKLAGIDISAQWAVNKRWQYNSNFAYVNGENASKRKPLIDMPPATFNNKLKFSEKDWKGLTLELQNHTTLFQDRYPNYNFTTNIVADGELTPVTVQISRPPPAYSLWDFYSEMKFKSFGNGTIAIAFSIQNILNKEYRDYLNRQRFFTAEAGRNFELQLKINY